MDQKLRALRRRKIGVLYGGWSAERSISLKSGAAVCRALKRLGLPFKAIDVDRRAAETVRKARVDLAFLAMHGPYGEDGALQGLLDMMGVAYTGSGVLASALAMHKPSAKRIFETAGLPTPRWMSTESADAAPPAFKGPWFVKPASQGSAIGVNRAASRAQWRAALKKALAVDREALAEELIVGTEITVGVLGERTLPVVEIVPKHEFYDFFSKYAKGGSRHLIPSRLSKGIQNAASDLALRAFKALGCRHLGRVDLMVSRAGKPYILEVNTLPGLTDVSLLPDAAKAVGLDFDALVLEILSLALRDAGK